MSPKTVEELGEALPERFSVALIFQESPSDNPWLESRWEAIGILPQGPDASSGKSERELIHEEGAIRQYRQQGFTLRLHVDECESYYHNLLAPSPCCYVVVNTGEDGQPDPLLLTLSFDEAHAYLEGEEDIYTVPMPAEIYQWTEAFVLANYVPLKRIKRKRQDWRKSEGDRAQ